jgi:PIN domain nuclease of toxin-antitoxin system
MKYLLDTHTLIWSILDTKKLSKTAIDLLAEKKNEIYVSTISFWEISLKTRIGKFSFDGLNVKDIPKITEKIGFAIITLNEIESSTYHELSLKKDHKDPFDRMLIWQSIKREMTMVSRDDYFKEYKKDGLNLVW